MIQIISDSEILAELTPVYTKRNDKSPFGLAKGEFVVPDDFNKPLSDSELKDFGIDGLLGLTS